MSIDKELLDQLMEGRKPEELFGKDDILQDLTKALALQLRIYLFLSMA
ncbi:MAG: hypothetical protein OIF56_11535 [Cohaesibacter sp.]|nr:hypothetical protein [Cohaesibacter sp.]MCV6602626.1 hypothetical protein [Cohaesibacter sp.]